VNSVMNLQFAQKRKNLLLTDLSYSRTLIFGFNKAVNPTILPAIRDPLSIVHLRSPCVK